MLLIKHRTDGGEYEPTAVYVDGELRGESAFVDAMAFMEGDDEDAVAESLADGYTKVVSHPDGEPLPSEWRSVIVE
ncbi:hypothetical protein Z052_02015 [Halorubrum sp. C191]|uniref:hypothetical protein n=1 Tax=Halorubrum sp. C191 TaxID=1383842 RepID=UPI000C06CA5E|nr:hypothetical protein [Halorubrum sp. C191]PHQ43939.1 hypothetical protein Z052_02015 [Halorubrum sp. C191]